MMNLIKRNIFIMSFTAIFGLVLFVLGILKNEQLLTMGLAIFIICIIKIIRYSKLLKNPEKAEKFTNSQTDERTIFIARKSYSTMFWLSVFIEFIASCCLALFNKNEIATILSYIICIQLALLCILYWYNDKKY